MALSGLSVLVAFSEPLVYKRRTSNVNGGNITEATVLRFQPVDETCCLLSVIMLSSLAVNFLKNLEGIRFALGTTTSRVSILQSQNGTMAKDR